MPARYDNAAGRVFDTLAERYDRWFDSSPGREIFRLEVACLRALMGEVRGRWVEVGVGTGRFARALGVGEGLDPSGAVLRFAAGRGIRTRLGRAENLPYPDASLDGILMVVTICFLTDPVRSFRECARVLGEGGRLVVGLVPADSAWGRHYAGLGSQGHPFYSVARFYTPGQVMGFAAEVGLVYRDARSCLFDPPGSGVSDTAVREGVVPGAGFVAMEFVQPQAKAAGERRC